MTEFEVYYCNEDYQFPDVEPLCSGTWEEIRESLCMNILEDILWREEAWEYKAFWLRKAADICASPEVEDLVEYFDYMEYVLIDKS